MISIELWRARIGSYRGCKRIHNSPHLSSKVSDLVASFSHSVLLGCIITILLIIGGIEINPGPITPTNDIPQERELPAEIKSFIEALLSTNQPIEQLFQSLSVSTTSASSIWGSICKKVYSCNKPDKRHCLYLKWKNNSYNIRNTVRDSLNTFNPVISRPCPEEQFHVSFNLTNIVVEKRASLVTATLAKDIKSSLVACSDSSSFLFDNVNLGNLEFDLLDDKLLIVWASSSSDLAMYDQLRKDSSDTSVDSVNSVGQNLYYLFNTTECQLWVDGAMFYGLTCPRNLYGFLQFEEICFFDECHAFIATIENTYSKRFVECTPLVVLWLSEVQLENGLMYQMFGKKYAFLTSDDLKNFITWIIELRNVYDTNGIKCLESKYAGYCVLLQTNSSDPLPLPLPLPNDIPDIECQNFIETSKIDFPPQSSSECGEFFLQISEWNDIQFTNSAGQTSLVRNWTNIFADKFNDIIPMCVLKFKNYWLKKPDSRKVNSPFFRARASCKFENCCSYIFYIDEALDAVHDGVMVKFYSEGALSPQHNNGESAFSRHLTCDKRSIMGEILVHNSVSKIYNRQFNNASNESICSGNLTSLKTQDCLRKVKSEMKSQNRFSDLYMEDVLATQQFFRHLLADSRFPGYVQYFVQEPFILHMFYYKQLEILHLVQGKDIILNLDATGSLISKPPSCSKKIFYYALTIAHPEFITSPIPLAEMISSDHSTAEISHFLNKWFSSVKLFTNDLKVRKVEIDFSWAMMHSTCLAFNKFNVLIYLQYCWEFIACNENLRVPTVLHLCTAHIMHRISFNLNKKFNLEKSLKRIILYVVGRMVNCSVMGEINQLFGLICYILCSRNHTSVYCDKFEQLEKCIKEECIVSNDVPNEFEDETEILSNGITYREKSPFGRHFEQIFQSTLVSIKEVENNSQTSLNLAYNPQVVEFLLTYYMPLLPLWSGIILYTVSSSGSPIDSNAYVENWFRIVKHSIFNSETGIRAADFIRTMYTNIDDKIAAFTFAFTPLASKVFKHKKRLRVENEEECQEEWSRSKKSKFSYTKPTVDKVNKAFNDFKSSKGFNVRKCATDRKVTTLPVDNSGNVKVVGKTLHVDEIEIISDLDIIEMASLDYTLPAFQPLSYQGQNRICEDLQLHLVDCPNFVKGTIPINSNLKEYVPSKLFEIPGDGNCLFASLSYWMTGSIDSVSLVRFKVVENMLGKLKEVCNKFIMNKFPKCASNYRNVADYVVKSNMKRNYTWGGDVEMFAAALLMRTDIWIYSSDMGNKWMVFSGRGSKLIDALELTPANDTGSIYLNHNGQHYEPVLQVDLKEFPRQIFIN